MKCPKGSQIWAGRRFSEPAGEREQLTGFNMFTSSMKRKCKTVHFPAEIVAGKKPDKCLKIKPTKWENGTDYRNKR